MQHVKNSCNGEMFPLTYLDLNALYIISHSTTPLSASTNMYFRELGPQRLYIIIISRVPTKKMSSRI